MEAYGSLFEGEPEMVCETIALADDPEPAIEFMAFCYYELNAKYGKLMQATRAQADAKRRYMKLYEDLKRGCVCQSTTTSAPRGILSRVAGLLTMRR